MSTWRPAINPGGISSKTIGSGGASGELILALDAVAGLLGQGGMASLGALIVSMGASLGGSGAITSAQIQALLGLAASITGGGGVLAQPGGLGGAVAAIGGAGSVLSTPAGLGSLSSNIKGYGDLTPEGIRDAIWDAVAAEYNKAGTMGAKLNAASASGSPWESIIESGLSAADILRIVLSAVAGKREGIGTAVESYFGQDGTRVRIEFAHDENNNGSPLIDGSI